MSDRIPERPGATLQRGGFAIVSSTYNAEFVRGLVEGAKQELEALVTDLSLHVFEVPGAFEIPLLAQESAARGDIDAVLALGVIIQGQTRHAELIGRSVTESLQRIALAHRKPVLHEVLLVADAAQARRRCLDPELNRGAEAARSAVAVLHTLHRVRQSHAHG